jgi:hypothetical protein
MRFEVQQTKYNSRMNIYLSMSMDNINPLDVDEDLKDIKQFLMDKYMPEPPKKFTFKEWLISKMSFKK